MAPAERPPAKTKRRAKAAKPRKMTPRRLRNIALFYLERFSSSTANLKQVLLRRAYRALQAHGGDKAEVARWIDELVASLVASGAINDASFARGRAATLRKLGRSSAKIRARLASKGVARGIIETALAETAQTEDGGDADYAAAVSYARRRRLGPFGAKPADAERRRKDMAAMARAGFSYGVAKKVMDTEGDDT